MFSGRRIDKLSGNPHPIAELTDAALGHILDAQLPTDALYVDRLAPILKRGVAGDDEQRAEARQLCDYVLSDAIAEVLLLRVTAQVVEWQHSDGGFVGGGPGSADRHCRRTDDAVNSDR